MTPKPTITRPNEPIVDTPQPDQGNPESDSSEGISDDNDNDNAESKETQKKAFTESQACFARSRPGHIPDGLGVIIVNEWYEQDNKLWMMTSCFIFYSVKSNCMYAGKTTAVANNYESHMDTLYMTDSD